MCGGGNSNTRSRPISSERSRMSRGETSTGSGASGSSRPPGSIRRWTRSRPATTRRSSICRTAKRWCCRSAWSCATPTARKKRASCRSRCGTWGADSPTGSRRRSRLIGPVLVVDELVRGRDARPGPEAGLADAVGDCDQHLGDVVVVITLRQLMAEPGQVHVRARFAVRGHERWVDRDADDVVSGRDRRLPVAAVQYEVLATEPLEVGVGVTDTDPLVTRDSYPAADAVHPGPDTAIKLPRRHVDHTEPPLGGTPGLALVRG